MTITTEQGYCLPKDNFVDFFQTLQDFGEVIAPKQDNKFLRMSPVNSVEEINWDGVSWFPSKKYCFPETQTLFEFDGKNIQPWHELPAKRVLFGLRLCDLNSIYINDELFLNQKPKMNFYEKFRENLFLVGIWCDQPQDEYCFCDSLKLQHKYDLCLFDKGDYFHIKTGSANGVQIMAELKLKPDTHLPKTPKCKMKLKTTDIKEFFDKNEIWQQGVKDCLSCGDCTTLCPTCLCFDIQDETDLSGKCGERCAKWDGCMYKDFTLVAGGKHFRGDRLDRFKHRIYHKLQYFKDQFNKSMCTGCGRCIRGCPNKIDWVELLNNM